MSNSRKRMSEQQNLMKIYLYVCYLLKRKTYKQVWVFFVFFIYPEKTEQERLKIVMKSFTRVENYMELKTDTAHRELPVTDMLLVHEAGPSAPPLSLIMPLTQAW